MCGSCCRSSSGIGRRAAPCTRGSAARGAWARSESKSTAPRSGMRPAKSFRNMVAKPKIAFVGSPSFVVRFDGIAKNARKTSHDPSTSTSRSPFAMGGHPTRGGRGAGSPAKDWGTEERTMQRPPTDSAEAVYQNPHLAGGEGAGRPARRRAPRPRARGDRPDRAAGQRRRARQPRHHVPREGGPARARRARGRRSSAASRAPSSPPAASASRCAARPDRITTRIEDEGEGFDWRPYLEVDPSARWTERERHRHRPRGQLRRPRLPRSGERRRRRRPPRAGPAALSPSACTVRMARSVRPTAAPTRAGVRPMPPGGRPATRLRRGSGAELGAVGDSRRRPGDAVAVSPVDCAHGATSGRHNPRMDRLARLRAAAASQSTAAATLAPSSPPGAPSPGPGRAASGASAGRRDAGAERSTTARLAPRRLQGVREDSGV